MAWFYFQIEQRGRANMNDSLKFNYHVDLQYFVQRV